MIGAKSEDAKVEFDDVGDHRIVKVSAGIFFKGAHKLTATSILTRWLQDAIDPLIVDVLIFHIEEGKYNF